MTFSTSTSLIRTALAWRLKSKNQSKRTLRWTKSLYYDFKDPRAGCKDQRNNGKLYTWDIRAPVSLDWYYMENLDFNTVGVGVICFYSRCQQSSTKESQNKMQNGSRLHLSRCYTPLDLCVLKQLPRQNIHWKEPDCPASEEAKLHLDNRLLRWVSFFLFFCCFVLF